MQSLPQIKTFKICINYKKKQVAEVSGTEVLTSYVANAVPTFHFHATWKRIHRQFYCLSLALFITRYCKPAETTSLKHLDLYHRRVWRRFRVGIRASLRRRDAHFFQSPFLKYRLEYVSLFTFQPRVFLKIDFIGRETIVLQ